MNFSLISAALLQSMIGDAQDASGAPSNRFLSGTSPAAEVCNTKDKEVGEEFAKCLDKKQYASWLEMGRDSCSTVVDWCHKGAYSKILQNECCCETCKSAAQLTTPGPATSKPAATQADTPETSATTTTEAPASTEKQALATMTPAASTSTETTTASSSLSARDIFDAFLRR